MTSLKQKFDEVNWDAYDSVKRLSMANAYNCIEPHMLYRVQPDEGLLNKDIQKGLDQVTDPWQQADDNLEATC
jgi:hypothetical protein